MTGAPNGPAPWSRLFVRGGALTLLAAAVATALGASLLTQLVLLALGGVLGVAGLVLGAFNDRGTDT